MATVRKKLRLRLLKLLPTLLARFVQVYVWLVFSTSRVEAIVDPKSLAILQSREPFTLTLWHNRILLFPKYIRRFCSFAAVISTHTDGDILAKFLHVYGHGAIRGSSRHGGFGAIKGVLTSLKAGASVVITPDGPLGPPFIINSNMLNIAIKSKTSIVPVCYAAKRALVLKTWDKFIIPYPFNRIIIEIAAPFSPSEDVTENKQRQALQLAMNEQMHRLDKVVAE